MKLRWGRTLVLSLVLATLTAQSAAADSGGPGVSCGVPNAAGPAGGVVPGARAQEKKKKKKKVKLSLQADFHSASRVVNLGTDREAEEVTLQVNASPRVPPGYGRRLEVMAEPFISSSETGDTITFSEPTFSKLDVSGNRKRITFKMCIDPPNSLPAGKYASTVILEGTPPVEAAVMTITLNAKDGGGFVAAALLTAVFAFLVLLYKGASEKRTLLLAAAQKKPEAQRDEAVRDAEGWRDPICRCLRDLGWLVPTLAAVVSAFALLYAAYDANPAWGEGGFVTNAIALVGTGLAAVGAKAVFTQTPSTH